jgi:hypothetical protein
MDIDWLKNKGQYLKDFLSWPGFKSDSIVSMKGKTLENCSR